MNFGHEVAEKVSVTCAGHICLANVTTTSVSALMSAHGEDPVVGWFLSGDAKLDNMLSTWSPSRRSSGQQRLPCPAHGQEGTNRTMNSIASQTTMMLAEYERHKHALGKSM